MAVILCACGSGHISDTINVVLISILKRPHISAHTTERSAQATGMPAVLPIGHGLWQIVELLVDHHQSNIHAILSSAIGLEDLEVREGELVGGLLDQ